MGHGSDPCNAHTANALQPLQSSPGRKVYFLASVGYTNAQRAAAAQRCALRSCLGTKTGDEQRALESGSATTALPNVFIGIATPPLPLHILGHSRDPAATICLGKCNFFPRTKKLQRWCKAMCEGQQYEEICRLQEHKPFVRK